MFASGTLWLFHVGSLPVFDAPETSLWPLHDKISCVSIQGERLRDILALWFRISREDFETSFFSPS